MTRAEITFTLTIDAQEMPVRYRPDCYVFEELDFAYGHLEFHSPHGPRRRIPVSETGYVCSGSAVPAACNVSFAV